MSDDPDATTQTPSQDVTRNSGFNEGLAQAEAGTDQALNQPPDQPADNPADLVGNQTLNTPADKSQVPARATSPTRDASASTRGTRASVVTLSPKDQEQLLIANLVLDIPRWARMHGPGQAQMNLLGSNLNMWKTRQ